MTVSGVKLKEKNILLLQHIYTGGIKVAGGSFDLKHSGQGACGIPEAGDTMVLTGGYNHKYVTRWVDGKIIIIIMCNDSDDDHDFDNDNENEYFSIND